jgi:predicted AAA+ superfamily ATPase
LIEDSLAQFRITALLGPRQCGKTALARTFASESSTYFDLEDPLDLARLDTPRLALDRLKGLVVMDEIQLRSDLFPLLRLLADRPENPARFPILGSAAPRAVKGISVLPLARVGLPAERRGAPL